MRKSNAELMESMDPERIQVREDLVADVADIVAQTIAERGTTFTAVAKTLEMSVGNISQLLSGQRNMTLRTLADLAWALDLRVALTLIPLHAGWYDAGLEVSSRVKERVVAEAHAESPIVLSVTSPGQDMAA